MMMMMDTPLLPYADEFREGGVDEFQHCYILALLGYVHIKDPFVDNACANESCSTQEVFDGDDDDNVCLGVCNQVLKTEHIQKGQRHFWQQIILLSPNNMFITNIVWKEKKVLCTTRG